MLKIISISLLIFLQPIITKAIELECQFEEVYPDGEIQNGLFQNALDFRADHITKVETFDEFKAVLEEKTGFISIIKGYWYTKDNCVLKKGFSDY